MVKRVAGRPNIANEVLDESGRFTSVWYRYFEQMWVRSGGSEDGINDLEESTLKNEDIGVKVQAFDEGLESIAGLTTSVNKMIFTTSPDVYETTDLSAFGRSLIDDADAPTARITLGLEIGADVQAFDSNLDVYSANPLTADELGELQNINSVTITNAQWAFLGNFNQGLTTTDNVTFASLTVNGNISQVKTGDITNSRFDDTTGVAFSTRTLLSEEIRGASTTDVNRVFQSITYNSTDATNGAEDGATIFKQIVAGTLTTWLSVDGINVTFAGNINQTKAGDITNAKFDSTTGVAFSTRTLCTEETRGASTTDVNRVFQSITYNSADATNGAEDGVTIYNQIVAGTLTTWLTINGINATFAGKLIVQDDFTVTSGNEVFLNLPIVGTGTSGSLWNDSGTVKVVP